MNNNNHNQQILQRIQTWITTSLYILSVMYFLLRLFGYEEFSLITLFVQSLIISAIIGFAVEYWKISLPILITIGLIIGFQFLTGMNFSIPFINLNYVQGIMSSIVRCIEWALQLNQQVTTAPILFERVLFIFVAIISVISNWILPVPLLNIALLIAPMFFMEDLTQDPKWIVFLLVGLFCVYSSYAFREDPTKREQRPPVLFGLILIGMTFLIQMILPPSLFYNQELSQRINDIRPVEGGEITSFSLNEMGFYPQGNLRVGGPVTLTEEPYMSITAPDTSFYLRGAAYDDFNGNAWGLKNPQLLERYDWPTDYYDDLSSEMAQTFWFTNEQERDISLQSGYVEPQMYTIKTIQPNRIVFHGGKPIWIANATGAYPDNITLDDIIDDYSAGGTFYYSEIGMLVSNRTYEESGVNILDTVVPVLNSTKAYETFEPIRNTPVNQYADVVEELDPELYDILYVQDLTFKDRIDLMTQHFSANYIYELQVSDIPSGEPFVYHFLKSKQGYCVYFATLWSILLEDIGYETRYAEGFVVPKLDSADARLQNTETVFFDHQISASQAHAWTEVHIDGFGWYPIEATPGDHISALSNIPLSELNESDEQSSEPIEESQESVAPEESSESSEPIEESNEESSQESLDEVMDEPDNSENINNSINSIWIVIFGLIVLVLIFLLYIRNKIKQWNMRQDFNSILNSEYDARSLAINLWRRILRSNQRFGIQIEKNETVESILSKIKMPSNTNTLRDIENLINDSLYSNRTVDKEQLRNLHQYYKELELEQKEKSSMAEWILKNVVSEPGKPW